MLVFFLANALLIFLQAQVNHRLTPASVSFFIPGLMVVLAPLYLRVISAQCCLVLTGLWLDAALPGLPFGFSAVVFFGIGLFVHYYRNRFQATQNFHPLLLAFTANCVWLLLIWGMVGHEQWLETRYQLRFWVDFALSQLLLFLVGGWFFNLQRGGIYLLGWKMEPEEMPLR